MEGNINEFDCLLVGPTSCMSGLSIFLMKAVSLV